MFLIRLSLLMCVNLFLCAKCSFPVEKLCVDPACKEPISHAKGLVEYSSPDKRILSFRKNQNITITSKSRNDSDYWGAVINGNVGYVPQTVVREEKVLYKKSDLIVVPVVATEQSVSPKEVPQDNVSEKQKGKADQFTQPQPSDLNKSSGENVKSITPAKTYKVIEGTTIYADEIDEITPSATVQVKSSQTAVPPVANKDTTQKQERATIPPELINLNSNLNGGNVKKGSNFIVENVNADDDSAIIEDDGEDDDEGEGEEDEDEDEDEDGDGDGTDGADIEINENELSDREKNIATIVEEKSINKISSMGKQKMSKSSSESVVAGVEQNPSSPAPITENNLTNQVKMSVSDDKIKALEHNPYENPNQTAQQPGGLSGMKFPTPQAIMSENNDNGPAPPERASQGMSEMEREIHTAVPQAGLGMVSEEAVRPGAETGTPPQLVKQTVGTDGEPTFRLEAGIGPKATVKLNLGTVPGTSVPPKFLAGPEAASAGKGAEGTVRPNAETGTTDPQLAKQTVGIGGEATLQLGAGTVTEASVQPGFQAGPEAASVGTGAEGTVQASAETDYETAPQLVKQKVYEASATTPPSAAASQIPHAITPQIVPEITVKTVHATPSVVEEVATMFSGFSVSADSSPEETQNLYKPGSVPDISQEVEATTEAPDATPPPVAAEPENQIPPRSSDPSDVRQKVEETTEASIMPSPAPEAMTEEPLPKEAADVENASEDFDKLDEGNAEQPGMLAQVTGMFSGWFTSAPREELPDDRANYEAAFRDHAADAETKSSEAPLGTCQNPESGIDCKDFPSAEEQATSWSHWVPGGSLLDGVLKQSNTLVYLVVTAVTVLLFTLGHNFIEKRGKTGPLIAKINKLEHELLVMSKECIMFKDEVQSAREKITLYENSANDELVVSLQAELQEAKKIRSELESSIDSLQQELDTATEAGLDLNKMLSEVLTQKGGSETLLKSVESLQGQLDSQQRVIDEMTKKLGVKNQENEALQSALEAANDKTESLEEELTEIKYSLNLHLKEKEDLGRDLNSQINQLVAYTNELRVTKDDEMSKLKKEMEELQGKFSKTSTALTVKEEEVKALKESMKHLKGKGDVKMEAVFDFSRVKAELAKEAKENATLLEKLEREENGKKALTEQVTALDGEVQKLKKNYEEAEQKKDEAEKKLEVLSTYFKEKETQLQKELGLQEALWAQKKGDENAVCNMMKSLQEEVESYKSQNETLKKEILDQERGLKNQIAGLEQKAHENWVAARQAERNLEEAKQEMSQLRNRLVSLAERKSDSVEGRGNLRSTEEINGVEAASPILHDTSSPLLFPPLPLDPNGSNLLPPGFMPPPPFMPPVMGGFMPPPPFLPGDRRPPPLGRMSSPPLNNRFSPSSPGDYPFERMSSPPLSPPGSNYRSPNEDRDHYRHRMPPYPVPLHPRNWDDGNEMPGFIPIASQRDSRRDHKGSNVSSEHSSSESLDKSSRHSGRV